MTDAATNQPEQAGISIADGIVVQELDEGGILMVRCSTIQREAVDRLYTWLRAHLAAWDVSIPWLALYDLTVPGSMLTPYMRTRVGEFALLRPEVRGRVAFVMRRNSTASLLSVFTNARAATTGRPMRVWFSMDEALEWLREMQ